MKTGEKSVSSSPFFAASSALLDPWASGGGGAAPDGPAPPGLGPTSPRRGLCVMNEPADWGAPGVPGAPPCDGDQSIFESELSSPPLLERPAWIGGGGDAADDAPAAGSSALPRGDIIVTWRVVVCLRERAGPAASEEGMDVVPGDGLGRGMEKGRRRANGSRAAGRAARVASGQCGGRGFAAPAPAEHGCRNCE